MIIRRGSDPVASWRFASDAAASPPPATERDALAWAVGYLPAVLEILQSARLLAPSHVSVQLPAQRPPSVPARVDADVSSWSEIRSIIDGIERDWPGLVPSLVEVHGTGAIVGSPGEKLQADVVGVRAYLLGDLGSVRVATWCDAWLPFDLLGRPQPEVRGLNAPRLMAALEEIEKVIGFAGDAGESKFSACTGYAVSNRLDMDGEPIPMDELGYDDSWIAAQ